MKKIPLKAEERTVLGKKVKKLRREGILPANVYGHGLKSTSIQVSTSEFEKVYKEAGDTHIIELKLKDKSHPVLVKNLQKNYAENILQHVDFYEVNLKEKVKATISVILIGEAKAVTEKVGLLLQTINEIEVEALPDHLPENVEVSVEHLAAVNDHITVGDLKVNDDVVILTAPDQTVAKIAELVAPEPEPEPETTESEEGAEGEGEKPEGEANEEDKDEKAKTEPGESKP